MTISIRPYRLSDFDALYALWQSTLGASWKLTPRFLERMISGSPRYREGNHLVAEQAGRVVGFISTQTDAAGKTAGIPLLVVSPERRRQGIGTMLRSAAVERLRQYGVETVFLAHGGGAPFWPGVPLDSPGAVDFFVAYGWQYDEPNYDLTRDLLDYQTPPGVLERVAGQGIELRLSSPDEAAAIVEFERRAFPFWAEYFEGAAQDRKYDEILAAWDGTTVVGTLLIEQPSAAQLNPNALWHQLLGDDMGLLGAVGVDEPYQGRGIGLAMVARGSELLKARGVRQCMIGWTDLLDFYGKLGYTPWRSYAMFAPMEL